MPAARLTAATRHLPQATPADATLAHLAWAVTWVPPAIPSPSAGDPSAVAATRRYLRREGRDDDERAERLLAAAAQVDLLADAGVPPTWEPLQRVQTLVLGGPAPFRAGDAHARGRRMGGPPWLAPRFVAKLDADARDDVAPVAAAVRLYLDLVHVHPFVDGNARAARLGACWWLRLHRLPIPPLEPLVRCPKPPGADPAPLWRLLCV